MALLAQVPSPLPDANARGRGAVNLLNQVLGQGTKTVDGGFVVTQGIFVDGGLESRGSVSIVGPGDAGDEIDVFQVEPRYGSYGDYGINGRTAWPSLKNNTTGFGPNQATGPWPNCPHLETDAGSGMLHVDGPWEGQQVYDYFSDRLFYCNEHDPGDGGYVGMDPLVSLYALNSGQGIPGGSPLPRSIEFVDLHSPSGGSPTRPILPGFDGISGTPISLSCSQFAVGGGNSASHRVYLSIVDITDFFVDAGLAVLCSADFGDCDGGGFAPMGGVGPVDSLGDCGAVRLISSRKYWAKYGISTDGGAGCSGGGELAPQLVCTLRVQP